MHQVTNGAFNFIDKTAVIGEGTTVWHFAVVLADVVVGDHCSIGSHCEIGQGTVIGNNTRISAFAFLPPNSRVGSNVFISPHVMFCDDKRPACGNTEYNAQPPVIGDFAVIGANATILPGVKIGEHAFIGAGAIITKDVAPWATVYGEPSREKYRTSFDIYSADIRERVIAGEQVRIK
jgi:UDP-2-acetamido-3-amino-2,3-dideoxy-glucuronate N-acetyltransferase